MLLSNRTAIVYGASGAVGGAVASAFAREGAHVVLAARRQAPLDQLRATLEQRGGKASALVVDAASAQQVEQHLAEVVARHGPVRLAFNAISWDDTQGRPLTEMPFPQVYRPIEIGLATWFNVGTALARHMGEHGGGTILGISANAGREAFAQVGGFGIACAAVEHFLRQLAVENGPRQVRVCWVRSPGSPDAPGIRDAWALYGREKGLSVDEVHREFAKDTPLRRITSLAQVADAAVLLASDLASGLTATMLNATGGAQVD